MALIQEYTNSGNFLFRKRSYMPLILYVFATIAILADRQDILYHPDWIWSAGCMAISLAGLAVRIMVVGTVPGGTSGRNTKGQLANTLNTKGIYSVVRHPLYLGNFLMWIGLIIYTGNIWFIIATFLLYWIYYERIMFAEEAFLEDKFGQTFRDWAAQTPAIIPSPAKWQSPELSFSVKKVIRREYRGLFAVILTFAYINLLKNYGVSGDWAMEKHWIILLVAGIVMFITIRLLIKNTRWLKSKR